VNSFFERGERKREGEKYSQKEGKRKEKRAYSPHSLRRRVAYFSIIPQGGGEKSVLYMGE